MNSGSDTRNRMGLLDDRRARWQPRSEHAEAASRSAQLTSSTPSRVEQLCLQRGLKMTGQRRTVARVLSDADDYPDVELVYQRARTADPHISIATVYRTVRLLEEQGIVQRREFDGGRARYEASEHPHQQHIIEVDSGRVAQFQDHTHDVLIREHLARLGYELVSCRLHLFVRKRPGAPAQSGAVDEA